MVSTPPKDISQTTNHPQYWGNIKNVDQTTNYIEDISSLIPIVIVELLAEPLLLLIYDPLLLTLING